jgi:hypothetical protein
MKIFKKKASYYTFDYLVKPNIIFLQKFFNKKFWQSTIPKLTSLIHFQLPFLTKMHQEKEG